MIAAEERRGNLRPAHNFLQDQGSRRPRFTSFPNLAPSSPRSCPHKPSIYQPTPKLRAKEPIMTFLISEGPVQEASATTRLAPNQSFEKRFTLEGEALSAAIELLILSTPGFTHVSYNHSTRENVVRVSGDSEEIVGAVNVTPDGTRGLEIRAEERFEKADPSEERGVQWSCRGGAQRERRHKERKDSDLKISLTSNDDLYLSDDHLNLRSFEFSSSGKSEIQLASPSVVVAEDVSIYAVDASRIKIFIGKLKAKNVNLSITGSGDFQVAAPRVGRIDTSSRLVAREKLSVSGDLDIFYPNVHAAELSASVTGSGDVRIVVRNELHQQFEAISTVGHGQVDTGDMLITPSNVSIIDNRNVVVQATGVIRANVMGSGTVGYISEAPGSIEGSTANVRSTTRDPTNSHLGKMTKEKTPCHVPEKDAAFSSISVKESNKSVYKVKSRSFAELKDKVHRFFGFGAETAAASP